VPIGDISGAADLVFVSQHKLPVARGDNVGLDSFGTKRQRKTVRGQRMLWSVPTRSTVSNDQRSGFALLGRVLGHQTTVRDTVRGMSDEATAAAQVSHTQVSPDQISPAQREPRLRSRPRLNPLAVAALILGILFSPLAAVFGHIAAAQVSRSNGRERGAAIAWVSVGLGYLWLVVTVVVTVALWQFLLA
jgi:hypothetical protein